MVLTGEFCSICFTKTNYQHKLSYLGAHFVHFAVNGKCFNRLRHQFSVDGFDNNNRKEGKKYSI